MSDQNDPPAHGGSEAAPQRLMGKTRDAKAKSGESAAHAQIEVGGYNEKVEGDASAASNRERE